MENPAPLSFFFFRSASGEKNLDIFVLVELTTAEVSLGLFDVSKRNSFSERGKFQNVLNVHRKRFSQICGMNISLWRNGNTRELRATNRDNETTMCRRISKDQRESSKYTMIFEERKGQAPESFHSSCEYKREGTPPLKSSQNRYIYKLKYVGKRTMRDTRRGLCSMRLGDYKGRARK